MYSLRRIAGLSLPNSVALVLLACIALLAHGRAKAQSYTFNPLYTFPPPRNVYSGEPEGVLAVDSNGDIYGIAVAGGNGYGQVFEMVNNRGSYAEQVLYNFDSSELSGSIGGVIRDNAGNLFGATASGGPRGDGGVWELAYQNGTYAYRDLHDFSSPGGLRSFGGLTIDAAGNVYGIALEGGPEGYGTVFELANHGGGNYAYNVLYPFTGGSDGANPSGGLILDSHGNTFGAAEGGGGYNKGTIFELVNNASGTFSFQVLHTFTGGADGGGPDAPLAIDFAGNLFGTTYGGGTSNAGTVFEVPVSSAGYSPLKTLHSFQGEPDGSRPLSGVTLDPGGNIFGTTRLGGDNNFGAAYELVNSSGIYSEKILYSLSGGNQEYPTGSVVIASNGNIVGTSTGGYGTGSSFGTVWELVLVHAPTSVALTSSASPIFDGDTVTLTVSITANPAQSVAGTVTFTDGGTVLGTQRLSNNQASITVNASSLPRGNNTITATFSPSPSSAVAGSTASVVEVVNSASDRQRRGAHQVAAIVPLTAWLPEKVLPPFTTAISNPAATLNLLYAANGAPAQTGISLAADGALTATSFAGDGPKLTNINAFSFNSRFPGLFSHLPPDNLNSALHLERTYAAVHRLSGDSGLVIENKDGDDL